MIKKEENNELKDIMPVFHLKPETMSKVKNVLTLYVQKDAQIRDDQLEIENTQEMKEKIGDNTLLLGQVNNYVMIGKYCACNIPGSFLLENSRIPIYYLSIIYNRQFITGCLFNIFLYFDIDEDTKMRLDTPKKYYKALMNGNARTEQGIYEAVAKAGVDVNSVKAGVVKYSATLDKTLAKNREYAIQLGINGTPAFIIGDELVPGAMGLEQMKELLKK